MRPGTCCAPKTAKPNILVIFGDDIGMWNLGAYTHGMMGKTPNIDRIGQEGVIFTDHYGQPSCTAGRAAFIMGQFPVRTGMTTIGIPGSTRGIQKEISMLAEVLKPQGYATGQFGKNHVGDRNEFLPTMTASTSGSATSIISTLRRNPRIAVPEGPALQGCSAPAASSSARRPTRTTRPIETVGRRRQADGRGHRYGDTKRMETVDEEFVGGAHAHVAGQERQGR